MVLLRVFLLLVSFAGAALGIGYPWLARHLGSADAEVHTVRDAAGGFRQVEVAIAEGDAPVALEMEVIAPAPFVPGESVAVVTVSGPDGTVFEQPVSFVDAIPHDDNPQTIERSFRASIGMLRRLVPGAYRVAVRGGADALPESATLLVTLTRHGSVLDPRVQPLGFSLLAIGFVGLLLTFRRRTEPPGGGEAPRTARWGREAQS